MPRPQGRTLRSKADPVAIKFRPSYEYMSGALLWTIANGVVLLVLSALTAESTATRLGLLAATVVLLVVFYRIWRASEDATRWVAVILAVVGIPLLWSRFH
jgi:ABC-type nickel/cobalt efflux system permease component RcnA